MDPNTEAGAERGMSAVTQEKSPEGTTDFTEIGREAEDSARKDLVEKINEGIGKANPDTQMRDLAGMPVIAMGKEGQEMEPVKQAESPKLPAIKIETVAIGSEPLSLDSDVQTGTDTEQVRVETVQTIEPSSVQAEPIDEVTQEVVIGEATPEPSLGTNNDLGKAATDGEKIDSPDLREEILDHEYITLLDEAGIEADYRVEGMMQNGQTVSEEDKKRIMEEERVWTIDYFVAKHPDRAEKLAETNPEVKKALEAKKQKEEAEKVSSVQQEEAQAPAEPAQESTAQTDTNGEPVPDSNPNPDAAADNQTNAEGTNTGTDTDTSAKAELSEEEKKAQEAKEAEYQKLITEAEEKALAKLKDLKSHSIKKIYGAVNDSKIKDEIERQIKQRVEKGEKAENIDVGRIASNFVDFESGDEKEAFNEMYNFVKIAQKGDSEALINFMGNIDKKVETMYKKTKNKEAFIMALLLMIAATALTFKMASSLSSSER